MQKTTVRIVFGLLALTYVLTHFIAHAHAQSSLGIGTAETAVPSTGLFAGWLKESDARAARREQARWSAPATDEG